MNEQEIAIKVQEMRVFFIPVIEKAVKENVKILQTYFNDGEGCGCLLSQVYGIDIGTSELLDKACLKWFGERNYVNGDYGEETFGSKAIWSLLAGWDDYYHQEDPPSAFYNLGRELYTHYVSLGGQRNGD
jgi:hypothetical protein